MPPRDPKQPPKQTPAPRPRVEVIVHDADPPEPEDDVEEPASVPYPQAVVWPPGQSVADRDAFITWLDKQWGAFIEMKLNRPGILPESARDLRQRALEKLGKAYDEMKGPPEKVAAFVDKVVLNLIRNHLQLVRPDRVPGPEVDEQATSAPDPERAVADAELWTKLEGYVDQLSPEEREVFRARELHGMTFEVIAVAVGRPFSTVVSQHARALKKVQDMARASERAAELRLQRAGRSGGKRK